MKILLSGIIIASLCVCVSAGSTETLTQVAKSGYVDTQVQQAQRPNAATLQLNQR